MFNPSPAPKKYSSALVVGCSHRLIYMLTAWTFFSMCLLDSVDPGQTGPSGAVWSGSTLLYILSLGCSHRLYAYAHGILFLRVLGSVDPGRTDPRGAVWSGSTLFIFLYAGGCSYTPRKLCRGYTVFTLSVRACVCPSVRNARPCVRPSVTLCFLNNSKSHCWIFIKPCKHVHICKTNTLDKKVRARGQFY